MIDGDMDDMIEAYFRDKELPDPDQSTGPNWATASVHPEFDGRLVEWLTLNLNFGSIDDAEEAWPVILTLIERAPNGDVIDVIGASAIEDLVNNWGDGFLDRIAGEADRDVRFRRALSDVNCHDDVPSALRALVAAARAARPGGPDSSRSI